MGRLKTWIFSNRLSKCTDIVGKMLMFVKASCLRTLKTALVVVVGAYQRSEVGGLVVNKK